MKDLNSHESAIDFLEGSFANTRVFDHEVSHVDGKTILTFEVGDIDRSELHMSYNSTQLQVEVEPVCHGFLVPSFNKTFEKATEKQRLHLENNLELHWADCTAGELINVVVGWFEEEELNLVEDFAGLVRLLITPVAEGLTRLRDTHRVTITTEMLYDHLRLDVLDQFSSGDCPPSFDADAFKPYLDALPGYKRGCPDEPKPKAYSIHGYILMHLSLLMRGNAAGVGKYRRERLFTWLVCFPSVNPIISAQAKLVCKTLTVELTHPSPDFVKFELSSVIPNGW